MKIKMMAAALLASMVAVGSAQAMDSDTLQQRMQAIQQQSEATQQEQKIAALEQEVADLKALLQETVEAFQEANM